MSTNVILHAGHDVAYFTSGRGRGGCAGAMSYYTAAGEPPGQWAGKGAAALGLTGQVDPDVIGRLYQENIGPGGELLVKRRQSKAADDRETAAVAGYLAAHPYASAVELAEVRAAERGKDPHTVPYFDLTVSAVKSVSVLHASYRVSARQALYPDIDEQITARLSPSEAWRYQREHSRPVLQHTLQDAQLAGHDIGPIIDRITADPMDGARSIASVLHGRLLRLQLPSQGHSVTWAQAAPGPVALAGDGVIGKGELDQPDLAEFLGQEMRDLLHRRLMITHERPDDLLVLLGPAGWEEDPDP